jgi:hypothetical protein
MSGARYTCEACGETFSPPDDWTDDDAAAEFSATFGAPLPSDAAVVCDPCYKRIIEKVGPS